MPTACPHCGDHRHVQNVRRLGQALDGAAVFLADRFRRQLLLLELEQHVFQRPPELNTGPPPVTGSAPGESAGHCGATTGSFVWRICSESP
jgi:hypothetical protein